MYTIEKIQKKNKKQTLHISSVKLSVLKRIRVYPGNINAKTTACRI